MEADQFGNEGGLARADRSAITRGDEGESWGGLTRGTYGPEGWGQWDPSAVAAMDPLAAFNAYKETLTGWQQALLAAQLANPFGKSTILDVIGASPPLNALGFAGNLMAPGLGTLLKMGARAGFAGTGQNADWGGGFSIAQNGPEPTGGISRGGQTVNTNLYAQAPEEIMSDASPLGLFSPNGMEPPGAIGGAGPTLYPPQGLPMPPATTEMPPQQGLQLPPSMAQGAAGGPPAAGAAGPDKYQGLPIPEELKMALRKNDAQRAAILEMGLKQQSPWRTGLQGLALGIAGAGDVARNLQTDPKTGNPLYTPSAANMTSILAQQGRIGEGRGTGESGGASRQKMLLDANQEDRKSMLEIAKFAQSADAATVGNFKTFIENAAKMREDAEASGADPAGTSNAILAMARTMKLDPSFDVLAAMDPQTKEVGKALGALAAYLPPDPKDAAAMVGMTLAQIKKDPVKGLEAMKGAAAITALPDATARVHAAVKFLRGKSDSKGPLPVDDVRDLVVGMAGDKAIAMREAFAGTLFTSPEMKTAFNTMLTRAGVEGLDAQGDSAEETRKQDVVRAGKVKDIPVNAAQAAATGMEMIPVDVARAKGLAPVYTEQEVNTQTALQPLKVAQAAAQGLAAAQLQQGLPVSKEKQSNYVDIEALRRGEFVQPPAGMTKGALDQSERFAYIEEKQKQGLTALKRAEGMIAGLNTMSKSVITATSPGETISARGEAFVNRYLATNPAAKTYQDTREAFLGNLARELGGERGVLTDNDIKRMSSGLPGFGDTVQTRDLKWALMRDIVASGRRAYVDEITGRPTSAARSQLEELFGQLDKIKTPGLAHQPGSRERK